MATPTDWYPAEYYIQPYYPRVFKVQDIAPLHLLGSKLVFWEKCRDAALKMWKAGASFRTSMPAGGYKPGYITLDVAETQDGTGGQAAFGSLPPGATIPAPGVGWVHIDPYEFDRQFASGYTQDMKAIIAHEVGHTLGFGHGGTGIMTATHTYAVSDEEITALRAYWKT